MQRRPRPLLVQPAAVSVAVPVDGSESMCVALLAAGKRGLHFCTGICTPTEMCIDICEGRGGCLQGCSARGRVTEARLLHPWNALPPIFWSPSGRVTEVRLLHPSNARFPILWSPSGRVTEVRLVQSSNAHTPTSWSPCGRVTEVRLLHPLNADTPTSWSPPAGSREVTPQGTAHSNKAQIRSVQPVPVMGAGSCSQASQSQTL